MTWRFVPRAGASLRRMLLHCAVLGLLAIGAVQTATAAWIPAKAALAQVLLERAFAQSAASGEAVKPWPWADMVPLARISVPRLGEEAIVLSGASGQALAFGPTQVPTPQASQTTVLAAHRDTHFAFMRDIEVGDILHQQELDGNMRHFVVERMETVRWDRFAIPQTSDQEWLVLATCYPFDTQTQGPLRRVVWARRIAKEELQTAMALKDFGIAPSLDYFAVPNHLRLARA